MPQSEPSPQEQREFLVQAAEAMATDWEENVNQVALTGVLLTQAAGRDLDELLGVIRTVWEEWNGNG